MTTLSIIACIAFSASLALTPLYRSLAKRFGIVDHPDSQRKFHDRATPLGGGVVVLTGFVLAVLTTLAVPNHWSARLWHDGRFIAGFLFAVFTICAVGLFDDRFGLRGRQKLFGQVVAASILIASGLMIDTIKVFSWELQLGPLAIPFTLFWLLGATNALNLIDGIDGLATSIGIILAVALAIMALLVDHGTDAVLAMALAGSLAGFLYYNFPPASIFLGDAGSMLIGLVLGALAIRSSLKGPATIALAAPTAICAIPILDVSMAILRRRLTGRSIYTTDRGHLHHCLLRRGYSNRKTLLVIGVLCALTATGALVSVYRQNELLAIASVVAVVGMLIFTRFFGHAEFLLLCRRLKIVASSLMPWRRNGEGLSREVSVRLQGSRPWEELWQMLVDFAERYQLSTVQLNVHLPLVDEDYHADWRSTTQPEPIRQWHVEFPLVASGMPVGRLKVTGPSFDGSVCGGMGDLLIDLQAFETEIVTLLEEQWSPPSPDDTQPVPEVEPAPERTSETKVGIRAD